MPPHDCTALLTSVRHAFMRGPTPSDIPHKRQIDVCEEEGEGGAREEKAQAEGGGGARGAPAYAHVASSARFWPTPQSGKRQALRTARFGVRTAPRKFFCPSLQLVTQRCHLLSPACLLARERFLTASRQAGIHGDEYHPGHPLTTLPRGQGKACVTSSFLPEKPPHACSPPLGEASSNSIGPTCT